MEDNNTIRILIADDHPAVREGLSSMLQRQADFEVVGEAADGLAAVQAALSLVPDVILMDLRMPKADGVSAIKSILADNPEIAIIILTTYDDDHMIRTGLQAGARGYLLKDAPREQLFHAIRTAIAGGSVLHPAIAVKLASGLGEPAKSVLAEPLTDREYSILTKLAEGFSNKEIAHTLALSENTVKSHVAHIYEKLSVSTRTEAVTAALKLGILSL